ncbi:MAG: Ppx/GppA phosphatase family protein [Bacillota bacterium]
MRLAAVDVGTNSTRLLIVQYEKKKYKVLERDLIVSRLGEGVDKNKYLNEKAILRTVNALEQYDEKIKKYNVKKTKVVGTSALRDVKNKADFVDLLSKKTSLEIKIISGNEEAQYIYNGVKTDINNRDFLVLDIGGGSTEFIWKKKNNIVDKSLDIGAVRLTERVILNSKKPLTKKDYKNLKKEINKVLNKHDIGKFKTKKLIGVGGTITTLAAINLGLEKYDSRKIHKYLLSKENIDQIFERISKSNFVERKNIAGLNEKRADIITAGTVILKLVMEKLNINVITISERDILFGLINEALEESK